MADGEFDLIVIGAGLSGIAAARFYLDIHPDCRLVLLEQDTCLGGVWSKSRSYPGFWTQWTVGAAEFSDIPMARPPEEDIYYELFKSKYSTEYLEDYVDQHMYCGTSLRDRIEFGSTVLSVDKLDGIWSVLTENRSHEKRILSAPKLIVASGLTSEPNMPVLPGQDDFGGEIFHSTNFGQSSILSTASIKNVTVLGGSKSAADMVYASVKADKKVNWIIRKYGAGPAFYSSPQGVGPYKSALHLAMTRFIETLTPNIFNPDNWWTRFVWETRIGRRLSMALWNFGDSEVMRAAKFDRESAGKDFDKLKPDVSIFWQNALGGLLNHEDFWDTVAAGVSIFHDDIVGLDKRHLCLKGGDEVTTDVLCCGTGWLLGFKFFKPSLLTALGLPCALQHVPLEEQEHWALLDHKADHSILSRFPILADPPPHLQKPVETSPFRLYNGIAPLHDDTIAFIGFSIVGNYFRGVECQAIWATAFLDKQLMLPALAEMERKIALTVAWNRRRYLTKGQLGNWAAFDTIGYTDKLLTEVGLSSHRKGWYTDLFATAAASDLAGLKDEYLAKYGYGGLSGHHKS